MFGGIATGQDYACGFYCTGTCHIYVFAIFFFQLSSSPRLALQVVWSANREFPVKINSTLELTSYEDLVLKDSDGTIAWSTNTSGKSVVRLTLTEVGNLLLLDERNGTVWQSFDHPTDSLLPGQILLAGQKLTASVSSTNWTDLGYLSFTLTRSGLLGLMETDRPHIYYQHNFTHDFSTNDMVYVKYGFGGLSLFLNSEYDITVIVITDSILPRLLKLGSDGHLRLYEWYNDSLTWEQADDLLTGDLGECGYPTACGEYAICTNNGQCSCSGPADGPNYFRQIDVRNSNLGCYEITPLSCEDVQRQRFLELRDVSYFTLNPDLENTNSEICKETCLRNCSCKAAIFQYGLNSSDGSCYLVPSEYFH
ncbi:hypothetical protein CDL15_Pgr002909 [Punica granatum]|uniref:Bulb-type lectin domain-containing protein n=1 Tax=Punica granatum TaxID=22663 RepID=A0A218X1M6_PUNGR|nr:hypothetical protein CDL15_Pgr002909 [Punica granatum]